MDKNLKIKLNHWIEFSKAIRKMYLNIIKHEQESNYDDEYNNLIYLLPSAIDIEEKRIKEINFTRENARSIKAIIDSPDDFQERIVNEETKSFEVLRRSNRLDEILLYDYNNFYSNTNAYNLRELIINQRYKDELDNLKYVEEFLNRVIINYIQMIEKYMYETNDKEVRDYLIYLKYALIATSPKYERAYIEFHQNTLPTIDININFPTIESLDEQCIIDLNYHNILEYIESDMINVFCLNNYIINESSNKKILYRILALNKARLISLKDDKFITSIERDIMSKKPISQDYSVVTKLVKEMFQDAHRIVNQPYYITKKVRKI